jgi:hypothetical protein
MVAARRRTKQRVRNMETVRRREGKALWRRRSHGARWTSCRRPRARGRSADAWPRQQRDVRERPRGKVTSAASDNGAQRSKRAKGKGRSSCSCPKREVNGVLRPTTAKRGGTLSATRRAGQAPTTRSFPRGDRAHRGQKTASGHVHEF